MSCNALFEHEADGQYQLDLSYDTLKVGILGIKNIANNHMKVMVHTTRP